MSLDRLRSTWERLGQEDALWAVLSVPSKQGGLWDVDEFLETGREHAVMINGLLADRQLSLGERVLDFGCGVGRLSNGLAELGPAVVGVDIAHSMIERAEQLVLYPERIRFETYDGRSLPFPDSSFDSAVSLMVLQHVRPAVQLACLLELQRVVHPGGALVLQIPSQPRPPRRPPRARVRKLVTGWAAGSGTARGATAVSPSGQTTSSETGSATRQPGPKSQSAAGEIEMHGLPIQLVRSLFAHCGCHVVDALPDSLAGEEWESYIYVVRV